MFDDAEDFMRDLRSMPDQQVLKRMKKGMEGGQRVLLLRRLKSTTKEMKALRKKRILVSEYN